MQINIQIILSCWTVFQAWDHNNLHMIYNVGLMVNLLYLGWTSTNCGPIFLKSAALNICFHLRMPEALSHLYITNLAASFLTVNNPNSRCVCCFDIWTESIDERSLNLTACVELTNIAAAIVATYISDKEITSHRAQFWFLPTRKRTSQKLLLKIEACFFNHL